MDDDPDPDTHRISIFLLGDDNEHFELTTNEATAEAIIAAVKAGKANMVITRISDDDADTEPLIATLGISFVS